ncbi:MAG TPA: electron transfer flavoprotein subunit alpha/FixB family protein [Gemmatimonadales bacterium]|nr:electron transfer flavoprotein subunit alpha/FixB family protein [Gemmatimonadales bacterium]
MANVLAVTEQKGGSLRKVSLEVVTAARRLADGLGGRVDALVVGAPGVDATSANLGGAGADRVVVATDPSFAHYQADGYAATVAAQVRRGGYAAVVFAATASGRDLAPRVAVRLDVPLAVDVTELGVEAGKVVCTRPVYAGKALQMVRLDATPALVSVRPNTFPVAPGHGGAGAPTTETVAAETAVARVIVKELKAAEQGSLDVAEAPIVVSGGRGMKGPEHFHLIEELAKAFGNAAVGASRAVVDAGWRPHGEQVGQTGKTVSPSLYIAVGISGAIQHLAGMRTAKTIVAINRDKDAPIFKVADYGIVGDAFEVLPALIEAVRKARAG